MTLTFRSRVRRMIWEKKCPAILMLTNEIEGGTRKCDRYWPEAEDDVLQYDLIIVSYIGTHVLDDFVVRKFTVEHEYVRKNYSQFLTSRLIIL
jgi:protein tyrosine phosphatase